MLERLDPTHRFRLAKFLCTFAWADESMHTKERRLILRFADALQLDEPQGNQVRCWLETPPEDLHDLSIDDVPHHDRLVFVQAISSLILADGDISEHERKLFERVLSWTAEAG
jgi:uncharacterized tellurite resistance protein B-like protein